MLQQTGVTTVIPYYQKFIARWPDVQKLAKAAEEDILKEWAGLGYYSRARNLHKCAKQIASGYKGVFPSDVDELRKLPGIGTYTANAIRAIAFDKRANVVDGNVERVMARVFACKTPVNSPKGKAELTALAETLLPKKDFSAYAQALMDLGATICTPQQPKCDRCPWQQNCKAFALGKTHLYPVKTKKQKIPTRHAVSYVVTNKKGRILLQQRPATGLLARMWEFPNIENDAQSPDERTIRAKAPFKNVRLTILPEPVTHIFSHFKLVTRVAHLNVASTAKGEWFAPNDLPAMATLHKKILNAVLGG